MAFIEILLLVLIRQVISDTESDYTTQCPARCDTLKEVDVLRQLLNQESLLRMSLDQQVQSQKMIIQDLENEIDVLNRTTEIQDLRQLLIQESLQRISLNQQVQNQTKMIQFLKNELDMINRKTENVTSALSQRDSSNVAFTVSTSSTLSNHNNRRIIYDKVLTNSGNAYNNITGIFTCPAPGNYVFTWSTMSRSSSEYCYAYIYHNSIKLLMSNSYESNAGYHEVASNTIVLMLSVGDMVWIQTDTCKYGYGYPYTAFSGWKM
ncbi:hypothetical protein FSP39_016407 [Pinctada imbricata]|uniref:C1q domain-containing protein n=1 Tax=Pinctada imbricata TaxID=66713 RepID=A0AA89CA21_PINIB|nr:hypothetical protein FSP39_016407 [Pinctada imbricata]